MSDEARAGRRAGTGRPRARGGGRRARALAVDHPRPGGQGLARAPGGPSRPRQRSRSRTSTPRPTSRGWTPGVTSASPASTRSPGASRRRCTGPASGPCASTPASPRPPRPTSASATCCPRARPACRWPSTCRPRWATTRDAPEAEGEVGRVGVPISSLADMEVLFAGIPLGEVSTSMTINSTAPILLGPVRGRRRAAGGRAGRRLGHDPERHPQGVHRPRDVDLPAAGLDAPRDRRVRVRRARAAQVEHDQHLGLPHARGRGHRGPGAGVHAGRRDRLRRGGRRPGPGGGRLRAPAVVLLRRLVRAVRGGRQVPGGPPDVGPDHAGSLRRIEPVR